MNQQLPPRDPHDEKDIVRVDSDESFLTEEIPYSEEYPYDHRVAGADATVVEPFLSKGEDEMETGGFQVTSKGGGTPESLRPGDVVAGRYQVVAPLGEGCGGTRYRVVDRYLRDEQLLTVLPPLTHEQAREFFLAFDQVKVVRHPVLLAYYEAGQDPQRGLYYYTSEFEPSPTLDELLRLGKMRWTPAESVHFVRELANGLAQGKGQILHLNLSPRAIRIRRDGYPRVEGMGMVQALPQMLGPDHERTGPYHAPELRDPLGTVDQRADVFSLGGVLYTLLTGEIPGRRLSPPSYLEEGIPSRLDDLVLQCLSPLAEDRCESAAALQASLARVFRRSFGKGVVALVMTTVLILAGAGAMQAYRWVNPNAFNVSKLPNSAPDIKPLSEVPVSQADQKATEPTAPAPPPAEVVPPPVAPATPTKATAPPPAQQVVEPEKNPEPEKVRVTEEPPVAKEEPVRPVIPPPTSTATVPELSLVDLPETAVEVPAKPSTPAELEPLDERPLIAALEPLDHPVIDALEPLDVNGEARSSSSTASRSAEVTPIPPRVARGDLLSAKNGAYGARANAQAAGADRRAAALYKEAEDTLRAAESHERAYRQADAASQYQKAKDLFDLAGRRAANPVVSMYLGEARHDEGSGRPVARVNLELMNGAKHSEDFGPGDLVADGWRVESIDPESNSVTLRNGRLVEVLRGADQTRTPNRLEARSLPR